LTEEVAPGARRLVDAALLLAISLAAVDATIVATAVPQIVGDLGGFHQRRGYAETAHATVPISSRFPRQGRLSDFQMVWLTVWPFSWRCATMIP
jgi:hypothetical protein